MRKPGMMILASTELCRRGPFYYRYTYTSSGTGKLSKFTAAANGDLNCDTLSTFERIGTVDAENNTPVVLVCPEQRARIV